MADEKKAEPLSEADFARLLYRTSAGCTQAAALAAYRAVLIDLDAARAERDTLDRLAIENADTIVMLANDLAAATARAEGAERETVRACAEFLREKAMSSKLTLDERQLLSHTADLLELGRWRKT